MQVVVLIKMCLNETYRSVQIQKQLPQFLNFALKCAITKGKRNEMNGKHQFLVYVDQHIRYGFVCVSKSIKFWLKPFYFIIILLYLMHGVTMKFIKFWVCLYMLAAITLMWLS